MQLEMKKKMPGWIRLVVVIGPEDGWNLGGRKGVWKGEVKVSALGQPPKLRQHGTSARASRLRACTRTGGFAGQLVRNANS